MGYKWPTVKRREGENVLVSYMKKQIHGKNNCINGILTGKPGSGKSWAMLSLACAIDPDFQLEGNWYFKAGKMFSDMKKYFEGDYKKGKMWLFDEAGIDLNNLRYMDEINKGFNAFFQTARHRNYIFLCTVPDINLISKGVRTLMNLRLEADGWIKKTNETKILPRVLEYNSEYQKFYKKRLVIIESYGRGYCNEIRLPKPPKKIVKEYEKMKKEFTSDLFSEVSSKINAFEIKAKLKDKPIQLTDVQETTLNLLKEGLNVKQIANKTGRTERLVQDTKERLTKKGYRFKPVREKGSRKVSHYEVGDIL